MLRVDFVGYEVVAVRCSYSLVIKTDSTMGCDLFKDLWDSWNYDREMVELFRSMQLWGKYVSYIPSWGETIKQRCRSLSIVATLQPYLPSKQPLRI